MTLTLALSALAALSVFAAIVFPIIRFRGAESERQTQLDSFNERLKEVEKSRKKSNSGSSTADHERSNILQEMLDTDTGQNYGVGPIRLARAQVFGLGVLGAVAAGLASFYVLELPGNTSVEVASASMSGVVPSRTRVKKITEHDLLKLRAYLGLPKKKQLSTPVKMAAKNKKNLPDVGTLTRRLAARLEKQPQDQEGWRMLGWSYVHLKNYPAAVKAYARASMLNPTSAPVAAAHGEAITKAANGTVTAEAIGEFERSIKIAPDNTHARYYLGLAKQQRGDSKAALADWKKVLADAQPNEPWLDELRRRMDRLEPKPKEGKSATGTASQYNESTTKTAANSTRRGPTSDDIRNAQAMSPGERQAMIRGMVDRLDERLKREPNDPERWIKLIRSRSVLGEHDATRDAYKRALDVFSDPSTRERITAAARELGVKIQ